MAQKVRSYTTSVRIVCQRTANTGNHGTGVCCQPPARLCRTNSVVLASALCVLGRNKGRRRNSRPQQTVRLEALQVCMHVHDARPT
jgi:hypothetical protein